MNKNFKDIINAFQTFTNIHYQTYEFGWGNVDDIQTVERKFPLIWVQPIPSNNNGRQLNLKFEVYVIDQLLQDKTNNLDVMNNTLLIGNDFIVRFFDSEASNSFYLDEDNVNITPFSAQFDHYCGGWIFEFTIVVHNSLNYCEIPTE